MIDSNNTNKETHNMEIIDRLNKAAADVGAVRKDDKNQAQGFKFRGIDAVVNACSPAFRKHGIVVTPTVLACTHEQVTVWSKGTVMAQVRVTVAYTFRAASDASEVTATVVAEAMDAGDKATAKAMSVAFRTCLLQTLCLPTDEPDPDHDTYERSKPVQAAVRPPAASQAPAAPNTASGGVSKSQRIVLEKVLARTGVTLAAATTQHLGSARDWDSLTRDDLGVLLPALAGGDE